MFAQGQRVALRGEEFLVSGVEALSEDAVVLHVEGLSELVRGKHFRFDTRLEPDLTPVQPEDTRLVPDTQPHYRTTRLFLESQLRATPPVGEHLAIGHRAAVDAADYQLVPAHKALQLPRPRLLIADAVGLGKTIEVGILLSELIARGRGKRILVLALKSILGQFQEELWSRFAIPLVRLDSVGIARIKQRIPLNKNPFEYYDKTIISIDTLKNNERFRYYLERSYWDVVVMDECHTVANRHSQRGDLAQLLSQRCESLLLTSATPHNGKRENFATLIRMIEPTAISHTGAFTRDTIAPYYVRRFKKDLTAATRKAQFRDREVHAHTVSLHPSEVEVLDLQQRLKLAAVRENDADDVLFSTSLFKAFLSSPNAAQSTLGRRIALVDAPNASPRSKAQLPDLTALRDALDRLVREGIDSKFDAFLALLTSLDWRGRAADPRIVVFAERIDTLEMLDARLRAHFALPDKRLRTFSGSLSDVDQMALIEEFSKADSDIRLLLCSDAGAQGVNLHHHCHRMVNYDLPWSLITLEQRNGRIDRFGQQHTPHIHYLLAQAPEGRAGLRTDLHILRKLVEKEQVVQETLGDAGSVLHLYDPKAEEQVVHRALAEQNADYLDAPPPEAEAEFDLDAWLTESTPDPVSDLPPIAERPSLFAHDAAWYDELLAHLTHTRQLAPDQFTWYPDGYLEFAFDERVQDVLFDLPEEALPARRGKMKLTLDRKRVQLAIAEARKTSGVWPEFHLLYDLHPLVRYLLTKMEASVDKGVAPLARVAHGLPKGTRWYVFHAVVANDRGQPVFSDYIAQGVREDGAVMGRPEPIATFLQRLGPDGLRHTQPIPPEHVAWAQEGLAFALGFAADLYLDAQKEHLRREMETRWAKQQARLDTWLAQSLAQIELDFAEATSPFLLQKKKRRVDEIDALNATTRAFYQNTTSLSRDPSVRVVACLYCAP